MGIKIRQEENEQKAVHFTEIDTNDGSITEVSDASPYNKSNQPFNLNNVNSQTLKTRYDIDPDKNTKVNLESLFFHYISRE